MPAPAAAAMPEQQATGGNKSDGDEFTATGRRKRKDTGTLGFGKRLLPCDICK
jgi:hypothetical protein